MLNEDLEKLKILANNTNDYIKALLIKLKNIAIENKHDMTVFTVESWVYYSTNKRESYRSHCRLCSFEIEIEHIDTNSDDKIYFDVLKADQKCAAPWGDPQWFITNNKISVK